MIHSLILKLFVLIIFPVVVFLQEIDEENYTFEEAYRKALEDFKNAPQPYCPEEGMAYFKDCQGELKGCSTCLGYADRMCQVSGNQNCPDCLILAGRACNTPKPMCFGQQECGGLSSDYRCINFECKFTRR